jgi:hypothetical protein
MIKAILGVIVAPLLAMLVIVALCGAWLGVTRFIRLIFKGY